MLIFIPVFCSDGVRRCRGVVVTAGLFAKGVVVTAGFGTRSPSAAAGLGTFNVDAVTANVPVGRLRCAGGRLAAAALGARHLDAGLR